ncbi:MAG: hypothetical protein JNM39_09020 [Bdellovibrionaceae bacterium]|nr:hypothetical protein [Pseudobdellovibrionaceae bacterium]
MRLAQKSYFLRVMCISLLFGLFSDLAMAEPKLTVNTESPTTHSIHRFCWPTVVNGPLGKPEDAIIDNESNLVTDGKKAELKLKIGSIQGKSDCEKVFKGSVSPELPNVITLTLSSSTCDDKGTKRTNTSLEGETSIFLKNYNGDETNGRVFWVDEDFRRDLGQCPNSFLMYTVSPIIY